MASLFGPVSLVPQAGIWKVQKTEKILKPIQPRSAHLWHIIGPKGLCIPTLGISSCAPKHLRGPNSPPANLLEETDPKFTSGRDGRDGRPQNRSWSTAGSTHGLVTYSPEYAGGGDSALISKVGSEKPTRHRHCLREPLILRAGPLRTGPATQATRRGCAPSPGRAPAGQPPRWEGQVLPVTRPPAMGVFPDLVLLSSQKSGRS